MNKKLYVGNLSFNLDPAELQALFAQDGRQVARVSIVQDKLTGRSRGFGFVEMATVEDAEKAIKALHGTEFMGRPLTVNEAKDLPPRTGGFGGGGLPRPLGSENRGGFGGGPRGPSIPQGGYPPPPDEGGRPDRPRRDVRANKDRDRKRGGGDDDNW